MLTFTGDLHLTKDLLVITFCEGKTPLIRVDKLCIEPESSYN